MGLLVLTPEAALDAVGIAAGLAGATSMALGSVLARRWKAPVSPLTSTAWQLTAGGLLLIPATLIFEPAIPVPNGSNVLGLAWLGLIGAALTYVLWFRGIARLEPTVVSSLLLISPLTAVLLGWLFLDQTLMPPSAYRHSFGHRQHLAKRKSGCNPSKPVLECFSSSIAALSSAV